MPAATIQITGPGAPLSFLAGATVTLAALPTGGVSYLWEFLDKPAGSVATFSTPTTQTTTFVADLPGSYFVRVTVVTATGVQVGQAIAACPFLTDQGPIRIPAAGETFEVDTQKGWATALQAALRLATLAYNLASSISAASKWKAAVRACATGDTPLAGAAPLVVDTISLLPGDRVLLRVQAAGHENGIYDYAESGGTYTLTRSSDADTGVELAGATTIVLEGTAHPDQVFLQTVDAITLGVTPLIWVLLGQSGTISVPVGNAQLLDIGGTRKVLRWTITGVDYEVELTQV